MVKYVPLLGGILCTYRWLAQGLRAGSDGCVLAISVRIFDWKKKTPLAILPHHTGTVRCVAFDDMCDSGGLLLSGGADNNIALWKLYPPKHPRRLAGRHVFEDCATTACGAIAGVPVGDSGEVPDSAGIGGSNIASAGGNDGSVDGGATGGGRGAGAGAGAGAGSGSGSSGVGVGVGVGVGAGRADGSGAGVGANDASGGMAGGHVSPSPPVLLAGQGEAPCSATAVVDSSDTGPPPAALLEEDDEGEPLMTADELAAMAAAINTSQRAMPSGW